MRRAQNSWGIYLIYPPPYRQPDDHDKTYDSNTRKRVCIHKLFQNWSSM